MKPLKTIWHRLITWLRWLYYQDQRCPWTDYDARLLAQWWAARDRNDHAEMRRSIQALYDNYIQWEHRQP